MRSDAMKSIILSGILITAALTGCSTYRPPLPEEHEALGVIPGLEDVRFWGDIALYDSKALTYEIREQIMATDPEELHRPQHVLAISGGGQNGAFGAGLLNGWTAKGDRPSFRMVTGISTGSIIAPFAFLGADYDLPMKEMYSKYPTKEVLNKSVLSGLFGGAAVTDSKPLLGLIAKYLDEDAIERIAIEHNKGRRLYVGTTNMDALRPVIWDLGAIAVSDHPNRADIIHRVILASASIPGVFPPVYFDVEKNGVQYNELHQDGGVGNQIFISPASHNPRVEFDMVGFTGPCSIYMIRNSVTRTDWELVKPTALSLAGASIGGLTRNQGNANQYVIYLQAKNDDMACYSARIPSDFSATATEAFDTAYMTELYALAYDKAIKDEIWEIPTLQQ